MTTTETVLHLLSSLLPSLSVLAFLLLHRRQSIRANLEDVHLRQRHQEHMTADQTQRTEAFSRMAMAFAPMLRPILDQLLERVVPQKPTATALSDEDLVAELDQRIADRGWKHGNPFAELDDLLERLWAEGVHVPSPGESSDAFGSSGSANEAAARADEIYQHIVARGSAAS